MLATHPGFRAVVLFVFILAISCGRKKPTIEEPRPIDEPDGAPCRVPGECAGTTCIADGPWAGGYCTTLDCKRSSCSTGECIEFLDKSSACLAPCNKHSDCRLGYACRPLDAGGATVCWPDDSDGPPLGAIGSTCATNADCRDSFTCDTSAPGGYCVGSCDADCPDRSICRDWGGTNRCVAECSEIRECRIGYVCEEFVCRPGEPVAPPFAFDITRNVLGVSCDAEELGPEGSGTKWRLTYEISPGIAGYTVVPFVRVGALRPMLLTLPSGAEVDLVTDYRHHNVRAAEFAFFDEAALGTFGEVSMDWPIIVPYSPERADLLQTGTHVLELATSFEAPCVYVVEAPGDGVVVDLNIIFTGLPGYSAAMAESDSDLSAIFERVDSILAVAGFNVGSIRYFDAPREIGERYAHVRDEAGLRRVTAFGQPRDQSLDGHLNVDMFLVNSLTFGGGAVLGLSAGVPGAPGLHGNPSNGLVFTGADIGSDNNFVAHIMAHELGHYLGLRHTTEMVHNTPHGIEFEFLLGSTDPIEDTPVCNMPIALGYQCPDASNLMFPAAPMSATQLPEVTDGQAFALHSSALFK